jgi:hypothetical protein
MNIQHNRFNHYNIAISYLSLHQQDHTPKNAV